MNIKSAAIYMKLGYRARRASWKPENYMTYDTDGFTQHYTFISNQWVAESKTFIDVPGKGTDDLSALEIDDIVADDWELITDNIRKYYNKYKLIEYNDDIDWDNYVSPKGVLFDDDDMTTNPTGYDNK